MSNMMEELNEIIQESGFHLEDEQIGFDIKSEHGKISVETTVGGGVWVSVNDVKLVLVEYDNEREAFVVRGYNNDQEQDDYEYIQVIPTNNKKSKEKLDALIKRKEEQLDIMVIDVAYDSDNNAHILAKRKSDNSFIVWTSINTGEMETTYVDFYNGSYDMDLNTGVMELNRRASK